MRRQGTAIARRQVVEPLAAIAAQYLVIGDALREQQAFDPVDVLDPLGDQHFALAAEAATIFLFGSQMERLSSKDAKIEARLVWIAVCACGW